MHFTIGTCNCKSNIKVDFFKLLWYILALRFSSRVLEHISVLYLLANKNKKMFACVVSITIGTTFSFYPVTKQSPSTSSFFFFIFHHCFLSNYQLKY